eukprot:g17354.t1
MLKPVSLYGYNVAEVKQAEITGWYLAEAVFFVFFTGEWALRFMGAKSWKRLYADSWMTYGATRWLARVFKLLKSVNRLATGLQISFRTLFWAILLIAVTVFIFGVLMVELVGKNDDKFSDEVRENWKDLGTAATSFLLLSTASGWQDVVRELKNDSGAFLIVIALFMIIVVVGILNMIYRERCDLTDVGHY